MAAEHVDRLSLTDVPVIALARLVVVAQDAFATDDPRQAVLEPMCRAPGGVQKVPDDDLCAKAFSATTWRSWANASAFMLEIIPTCRQISSLDNME